MGGWLKDKHTLCCVEFAARHLVGYPGIRFKYCGLVGYPRMKDGAYEFCYSRVSEPVGIADYSVMPILASDIVEIIRVNPNI